jgi:CubicO group peptidase (beta-lactamase class C family)
MWRDGFYASERTAGQSRAGAASWLSSGSPPCLGAFMRASAFVRSPLSPFAFVMLAASTPDVGRAQAAAPPGLDRYVDSVMHAFQVPGMAVAIVKDGRVVVARGYGVKRLGQPALVGPRTNFGIASNTKIFTATALGLLVEDGRIEWDAPVVRYLPAFAMYDPWVTRELTVRDLLVHRSGLGLGAGDLLWWPASTYDRKEIVRRLRFIKPATSFRSAYAYDNVLYSVAGELIEAVSGQSWEDFVASRILAKVGMKASNVRHSEGGVGPDAASPHAEVEGVVRPIAAFTSDNVNPAGGINSGAEDMAKWMIVQLDSGRLADGTRLFQPRTARQLWRVVTPLSPGDPPPELWWLRAHLSGYALGLAVSDYQGRMILAHTGGLPGFVSQVTMVPELRLGIAVLTNQESGAAFQAVTYRIRDHYLGAPVHDYLAAFARITARQRADVARETAVAAAARDSSSGPSLPLARYAGTYTDAWYGEITIVLENGTLAMRFSRTPSLTGDLAHWQHDTFVARWRDRELRADAFVTFALKPDGSVERATMQAVSPDTDFSFDFQDLLLTPVQKP